MKDVDKFSIENRNRKIYNVYSNLRYSDACVREDDTKTRVESIGSQRDVYFTGDRDTSFIRSKFECIRSQVTNHLRKLVFICHDKDGAFIGNI